MTRREQEIVKASVSWTEKVLTVKEEKAFQVGAKWADKTMIDKVEKYLRTKIILYTLATTVDQREEWFNDFRKTMED